MKSRSLIVALTVAASLLPSYLFVGFQLASHPAGWVALGIPFFLIWCMPVMFWGKRNRSRGTGRGHERSWSARMDELIVHGAYLSMGVVTYLLLFTVVHLLAQLLLPMPDMLGAGSVVAASAAAIGWGTIRAVRGPRLKEIDIDLDGLPAELDGLRIVHISDLHVGPTIRRAYVERVVEQANALGADIVALTGDIADGNVNELCEEIAPLANLKVSGGVYYVPGNHEYYWNVHDWTATMKTLGARVLMNDGARLNMRGAEILVAGVTDPAAAQLGVGDGPLPQKAFEAHPLAALKILLAHRPGIAHEAASIGFDLQLSGHTHGGQFFPWTLVVKLVHEFHLGLAKAGKMWVYVNSGTGSWGPLLRLGTTPELTLLRLHAPQTRSKI